MRRRKSVSCSADSTPTATPSTEHRRPCHARGPARMNVDLIRNHHGQPHRSASVITAQSSRHTTACEQFRVGERRELRLVRQHPRKHDPVFDAQVPRERAQRTP
jgi:hypothetical protein